MLMLQMCLHSAPAYVVLVMISKLTSTLQRTDLLNAESCNYLHTQLDGMVANIEIDRFVVQTSFLVNCRELGNKPYGSVD